MSRLHRNATSLLIGLVSLALAHGSAPAQPAPSAGETSAPAVPTFDASALDRNADPCVNFYKFACGSWMATHPIPPDKTRWGRFDELAERNREVLHQILESYVKPQSVADAVQRKVGDYYASCMDEAAIESVGTQPLRPEFRRIDAIHDRSGLLEEVAHLETQGIHALFGFGSAPDLHDATTQIAHVSDGGLTLPDRDYYLKDDAKSKEIRERYVAHVRKMLELAGEKPEAAAPEAAASLALETDLAQANMDRVSRRDPQKRDHRMSVEELVKLAPGFEFAKYFADTGAPKFSSLNVANPDFFKAIDGKLRTVPLDAFKAYLRWKVVHETAAALPVEFVREDFEFWNKYLRGQTEIEARWKRCTRITDASLGEALGRLYVDKAFPPEAKQRTLDLVNGVEKAMGEDLKTLPWMSDATKKKAEEKLAKITNKIGYPDKWRDYGSVAISRGDFFGNSLRADSFEVRRQMDKIGKPVDKAEWGMTPPTVNAYYNPSQNNVNFPAGILEPPFYRAGRDDAVNYGGIGAVIGHELTHGFDDQGAKFDANGNLTNWWSEKDKAEFDKRTSCLADEYERFSPVEGVHLNGKLTLGENTADNGGVRLAFGALEDMLRSRPGLVAPKIEDFTPEQRFFLGYAQVWCQNVTPESSRLLAVTDPHSPGEFRVNGVLVNSDAFQQLSSFIEYRSQGFRPRSRR